MASVIHDGDTRALRDRFFAAVTSGDIDAVRACYAPDAVIWHNNDGISQSVDENLRVLGWIAQNVRAFRYEDVRCRRRQRVSSSSTSRAARALAPRRSLSRRASSAPSSMGSSRGSTNISTPRRPRVLQPDVAQPSRL